MATSSNLDGTGTDSPGDVLGDGDNEEEPLSLAGEEDGVTLVAAFLCLREPPTPTSRDGDDVGVRLISIISVFFFFCRLLPST